MEQLEGRVAVITGGGSGIGEGLARACHAAGMRVVLGDVEEDEAARVANDVRELGGDAMAVRADVSSRESIEELAAVAYEAFGAVHLLCNNAGVALRLAARRDVRDRLGVDARREPDGAGPRRARVRAAHA